MPTAVRPVVMERDHFDDNMYDLYWRFIVERQRVYVRRAVLHRPWPWTTDPTINAEFITNMYRELDPGTQYAIDSIVGRESWRPVDKVFNTIMYRLMGSQPPTHELVAVAVKDYKTDAFVNTLSALDPSVFKVFGDAYRVAAYGDEKGTNKIENVGRLFNNIKGQMPEYMRRITAAPDVKSVYEVFKGMPGLGDFLSHQCTVDLLSGPTPVLGFGQEQWAAAGPGARAGMWKLLKDDVKPRNLLIVMKYLRDHQEEEFASRGLRMPHPVDHDGEPILLSLCNIQSTLCEFYKYARIWSGEKRAAVRKYEPSKATDLVSVALDLSEEELDELADAPQVTPLASTPEAFKGLLEAPEDGPSGFGPEELDRGPEDGFSDPLSREIVINQAADGSVPSGTVIHLTINIYTSPQRG